MANSKGLGVQITIEWWCLMGKIHMIHIEHSHNLTTAEAHERLAPLFKNLSERYGVETEWTSETEAKFSCTGLKGSLVLANHVVRIDMALAYALSPLKGMIERHVKNWLAQYCQEQAQPSRAKNPLLTADEVKACRTIGRNEADRVSTIGLAELDSLCDTADYAVRLHEHVRHCPLGWHDGRVIWHRDTSMDDIVSWLQKLHELSEHVKCQSTPPTEKRML